MIYHIIFGLVIILLIVYLKLKRSKRYDWVSYDTTFKDEAGKSCSILHYTDSFQSGIQVELFYDFQLNSNRVNAHIESMNKAWIKNKVSYQPKYKGYQKDVISLNK